MSIFAAVPMALLEDARLTPRQFRFMVALLSFCPRGKNSCFPSRALLAQRARLPIPRVSEVSAQLVELGWLAKEGNGGRGRATRYTILTPETVTKAVTVTDLVTVTETVTVPAGEDCAATDEETVTETVTVTEPVTVSEPDEQNGYRFKQKTVTDLVTPIEETRNRQEVLNPPLNPPMPAKPAKRAKHEPPPCLPDVQPSTYARWLAHRPAMGCRKPWTADAQARHVREAEKAGLSNEAAFEYAMAAQWYAFTATYYYKAEVRQNGTQDVRKFRTAAEIDAENNAIWFGNAKQQQDIRDTQAIVREQFTLLEKQA